MSEWTITFEGDEYEPIRPSWLDHPAAVDASQGEGPRLFASAVSTGPGKTLQIRYASPALKRVGICQTAGESHNGGLVPRALLWEKPWPRSIKASVLTPQDARRGTEIAYLQDIWTGRDAWESCVDVPASDEPAVVCPRCEAEHRQGAYRCDECGKDLVNVHAEEDERRLVADGGQSQDGTEWFIHRWECPDCGGIARADRAVGCFRCGTQVEHVERIGEVQDSVQPGNQQSNGGDSQ